jgi:hypothetical protein
MYVEAALEPVWTHTWGQDDGSMVPPEDSDWTPGGMTIENRFQFCNGELAYGVRHIRDRIELLSGGRLRYVTYTIRQTDHIRAWTEERAEDWLEYLISGGVVLRFPDFQVRYTMRYLGGLGRPGPVFWIDPRSVGPATGGIVVNPSDFLAAPLGGFSVRPIGTWSHQVALVFPLGG